MASQWPLPLSAMPETCKQHPRERGPSRVRSCRRVVATHRLPGVYITLFSLLVTSLAYLSPMRPSSRPCNQGEDLPLCCFCLAVAALTPTSTVKTTICGHGNGRDIGNEEGPIYRRSRRLLSHQILWHSSCPGLSRKYKNPPRNVLTSPSPPSCFFLRTGPAQQLSTTRHGTWLLRAWTTAWEQGLDRDDGGYVRSRRTWLRLGRRPSLLVGRHWETRLAPRRDGVTLVCTGRGRLLHVDHAQVLALGHHANQQTRWGLDVGLCSSQTGHDTTALMDHGWAG
ncbi:hypothetical protein B0T26DRAFT_181670 [Lasiosphaeria miniovina]|uniref:Uncharacterized protein n=1 Tax=Lasiosphaeria miniovina TaxID=1954250 RepID=A0AA40E6D5_9PEZI|nr:uncharacterized protein B0T26DRAFT_181670 [Lasiosphaeria miniovina]KAK0728675.1 hypothetical protein B0T26DRAFT_181670 [Lasiosphaeria miniovina]